MKTTANNGERTRVAVVGMGQMGRLHAVTYATMPEVALVGLVEPDERKHADLEREFSVPVVSKLDELGDQVEAVSICTPDDAHVEPAVRALTMGKFVLVEKPLAMDVADAETILKARRSRHHLMVGHILRFDPRVRKCRNAVREGCLGELWHVEVWRSTTRETARHVAERASVTWFLGVHDADLVRFVTGLDIVKVQGWARRIFSPHHDVSYAHLQLTGGVVGSMYNSWALPGGRPSRALAGLRLVGSAGMLELELGHHDILLSGDQVATFLDSWFWPESDILGSYNLRRELESFITSYRGDDDAPVAGEDGLAAVRVIESIERSIRGACAVEIVAPN